MSGDGDGNGTSAPPPERRAVSTRELGELLAALRELAAGDFDVRLEESGAGVMREIAAAFNVVAHRNQRLATEVARISTTVGREGQMTDRASLGRLAAAGARPWIRLTR